MSITLLKLELRLHNDDHAPAPCQWCAAGPGQDAGWPPMTILLWKPWTWCGLSVEVTLRILLWWDTSDSIELFTFEHSGLYVLFSSCYRLPTDNWPEDAPGRGFPQGCPNPCPPLGCPETRGANDPRGQGAPVLGPLLWQQENVVSRFFQNDKYSKDETKQN